MWKKELEKLWNIMVKQLTSEDLFWLRRYRSSIWKNFSSPGREGITTSYTEWQIRELESMTEISFRIQDIVDAKLRDSPRVSAKGQWTDYEPDRTHADYRFATGMPKAYLVDIAEILGLKISSDESKLEFLKEILDVAVVGK